MTIIISGSTGVSGVDGSAGTPSLQGGDANTGFFYGSDILGFSTGGTERMRLDSSGNLGLGITPSAWGSGWIALQNASGSLATNSANTAISVNQNAYYNGTNWIYNSSNYASRYNQNAGQHLWYTAPSGTAGNAISFTQAMTLDASGNLGIGTSSPSTYGKLAVVNSSASTSIYVIDDVANGRGGYLRSNYSDAVILGTTSGVRSLVFSPDNTERMRIDTSGNVGIGTSSPAGKVDAFTNGYAAYVARATSAGTNETVDVLKATDSAVAYYANARYTANSHLWNVGGTEGMRIDSSGRLLVATVGSLYTGSRLTVVNPNTSAGLAAAGFWSTYAGDLGNPAVYIGKYDNDNSTSQVYARFLYANTGLGGGQINGNGGGSVAFGTWSDKRLKTNIVDLPPQLDNILALRPVEFDFIESEGGGHQISFIAQEMQDVYPDVIGKREDGMLTVTGWGKTEARLVKAIQELKAELDATKAEVAALKGAA